MKQLLILSGKGGTGKTTVASAFIVLSGARKYADCDVDAPNLHLIMSREQEPKRTDFYGMPKSVIDSELCVRCGRCRQNCRFDAIDEDFRVILHACEGCAVCSVVCPSGAVTMVPSVSGELMLYERDAVFSTAQLKMGSGTSGKLVTEVKKQLKSVKRETELVIIDGSPGIGCPVIASISGVDMVLIVAEPSVSGLSDMKRVIQTAEHFKVPVAVCINKYDLNKGIGDQIVAFCGERSIPFTGMIPYDHQAVKAINAGVSITQLDCPSGQAVREVYRRTHSLLFPV